MWEQPINPKGMYGHQYKCFREEGEPCSLVVWVKIMSRKCKAVVDSGAQVTVINKDCFKEYIRGKPSRPARLKGVAEDHSLMSEVVDDVEIEMEAAWCQHVCC